MIVCDLALAARLERAEGHANAQFVEARAQMLPELGARWIEVAGARAMYDGHDSPCTQTFGLGISRLPTLEEMEEIEAFFHSRGAPAFHEVCAIAGVSLLPLLNQRGYRPYELSHVLYLPLEGRVEEPATIDGLRVRLAGPGEQELWAVTAAKGWLDVAGSLGLMDLVALMRASAGRADSASFLVERGDEPIAAGGLYIHEGVALMAGATTVPAHRRLGAQRLLFESRMKYASEIGCDVAMVNTEPGSSSQRNAERRGFRIAYGRIKWRLDRAN
jgi:hypothetical protein